MDPLNNPLKTCPIETCWNTSTESNLNCLGRLTHEPYLWCRNGSVPTQPRPISAGLVLLFTLCIWSRHTKFSTSPFLTGITLLQSASYSLNNSRRLFMTLMNAISTTSYTLSDTTKSSIIWYGWQVTDTNTVAENPRRISIMSRNWSMTSIESILESLDVDWTWRSGIGHCRGGFTFSCFLTYLWPV